MGPSHRIIWIGRLVLAGWLAMALAAVAWFGVTATHDRDELVAQAHHQVHARARLAAEHAARLFEGTDVALRNVSAWMGETPDWENLARSEADWKRLVHSKDGLPTVNSLSVTDAAGKFILHSDAFPTPERSVSDRPYFRFHQEDPAPVPFLNEAVQGRVSGRPVMIMSRRLPQADNRFVGIVLAAIRQDVLEASFASLIQAAGDHVTLVRLDGMVLLRHPAIEGAVGRKIPIGDWVFEALAAGRRGGTVERPSPIDGVARIFGVEKVGDYDLIAVAGQSRDELLSGWRRRLLATGSAMAGGVLLLTLALVVLLRSYRKEALAKQAAEDAGEQLRQTVEALTRSNAELERFAFVAAHDLQEPLRNVVTYAQIVEKNLGSQLAHEDRESLAILVDGARRMRTLVGDLQTYSRVSSRAEPFHLMETAQAVRLALANLKEAIDESGAQVCVGELPVVRGDLFQIALLFQNLIGNAIKYRRPDMRPVVDVRCESQGGEWRFTVADNGIGIDPRYAEQIFIIFKRLHTRETYPGTGLGLALCRRIVERHGGRIRMESGGEGKGSVLRFTLPVLPE